MFESLFGETPCLRRFKVVDLHPPMFLLPHTADFRFYFQYDLASSRSSNLGRSFVFHLASQRGPQKDRTPPHVPVPEAIAATEPVEWTWDTSKGHPAIPIRLQTNRNFISAIHLHQFSWVSTLTKDYPFPCSKNLEIEQR
ncbi:hypothetical protein AVEN_103815-1 [Araneus ventricosus]|uniref:Uncharacterized protein n=1 Tax=Araneus ventricosus TaxID=182803 RepID=A0A4Y2G923_ARAVE|nr:hypothetical protein AVEN_103815-1 [Araneus ventricosus]